MTFCSPECVHEWKLRSDPRYLRKHVWLRDKGMCRRCGEVTADWEADHITPVHKGGGECGLENMQTLCKRCHRLKTYEDMSNDSDKVGYLKEGKQDGRTTV
jgi:5-methylcytosine-specific restriction endonuclease McrA